MLSVVELSIDCWYETATVKWVLYPLINGGAIDVADFDRWMRWQTRDRHDDAIRVRPDPSVCYCFMRSARWNNRSSQLESNSKRRKQKKKVCDLRGDARTDTSIKFCGGSRRHCFHVWSIWDSIQFQVVRCFWCYDWKGRNANRVALIDQRKTHTTINNRRLINYYMFEN